MTFTDLLLCILAAIAMLIVAFFFIFHTILV